MKTEQKPINYTPSDSKLEFIRKTQKGSGNYNSGTKVTRAKALYKCKCGNEVEVVISNAKNGTTKSCGCLQKEACAKSNSKHGLGRHPLYPIYKSIIQRCTNPNNAAYAKYGGVGVKICDLWKNSFREFHDWAIGNGWVKGMQIDKDLKAKELGIPALEYSPEMCSILTRKQNANAKSNNRKIEYMGRIQNLAQWADELGVSHSVIQQRLKNGYPLSGVLTGLKKNHTHRRICKEVVSEVMKLYSEGLSQNKIGDIVNIDQATVSKIVNKKDVKSCHYDSV